MNRPLSQLLQNQQYDQALQGFRDGSLDPATEPSAIYHAMQSGNIELIQCFLDAGADPNQRSSPPLIQLAAESGHLPTVQLMLQAGADPNQGSLLGTPLFFALQAGHDQVAAALVAAGAKDADVRGSLLVWAAYFDARSALRQMIKSGFDLNGRATIDVGQVREQEAAKAKTGQFGARLSRLMSTMAEVEKLEGEADSETGTNFSALDTLLDQVEELKEDPVAEPASPLEAQAEASQDSAWVYDNAPAAVVAAGEGRDSILQLLATAECDLSAADDCGITPWLAAERAGRQGLVQWLQAIGAEREPQMTPFQALTTAVERGDGEALEAAIAAGADVNGRDQRKKTLGRTPLWLAVFHDQPESVATLVQAGAELELRDREEGEVANGMFGEPADPSSFDHTAARFGHTPLILAAVLDHRACADALISAGADINAVDDLNDSALGAATANGSSEVLQALLKAGADSGYKSVRGPLLAAAAGDNQVECLRLLLEAGLDPNIKYQGSTPLHMAAICQDGASIIALLDAGADADKKDNEGQTALAVARTYGEMSGGIAMIVDGEPQGQATLDPAVLERLESVTTVQSDSPADQSQDDEDWDDEEDWDGEIEELEMPTLDADLEARYHHEQVIERVRQAMDDPTYRSVIQELAERCGSEPRTARDGITTIHVHSSSPLGQQELDVEALQQEFHPRGVGVYTGNLRQRGLLILIPTNDTLEALRFFGCAGPNYDISNSQVMEFFRRHPAVITQMAYDTVVGRFDPIPEDLDRLALEIYSLCPDTIEQGLGNMPALVRSLADGSFYLWWD